MSTDSMRIIVIFGIIFTTINAYGQRDSVGGSSSISDALHNGPAEARHFRTAASTNPLQLRERAPTDKEKSIIEQAKRLMNSPSLRAMALVDGRDVIWMDFNGGAKRDWTFISMSAGKALTTAAVGKAVCAEKFKLSDRLDLHVKEFVDTDIGSARIADLLTMRSGASGAEGQYPFTIDEEKQLQRGSVSLIDLIKQKKSPSNK